MLTTTTFLPRIADANEAVRRDPTNASNFVLQGDVYRSMGDYERAILDYRDAIRLNPEDYKDYLMFMLALSTRLKATCKKYLD
jgi:cytochrome c-type biogenesis protein CcmH/NrfG